MCACVCVCMYKVIANPLPEMLIDQAADSLSFITIIIQWGKKVFSQPPIVKVLPLKKMREACNFHHR